jgi:hypothetical protein
MLSQITTIEEVRTFANQLIQEGTSFHPDDDFNDYVNFTTHEPSYTKEEADFRNRLMSECFDVCEKSGDDIYEVMNLMI